MRSSILSSGIVALLLTGCSSTITITSQLENPLFAERYAETVVDRLVEFDIQKDPIIADAAKKAIIDEERKKWLEIARDARAKERDGVSGSWITMNQYAKGTALYVNDMLYFDTLFEIDPLPSLHVYLTTVVDPRDVAFPDETAIDLGPLQTAYGAQSYKVPHQKQPELYRTAVLWDSEIGVLHSFAQMAK